ncbi:MAG: hypothetical protein Kow0079_08260 [Vicingaceae bacterium]
MRLKSLVLIIVPLLLTALGILLRIDAHAVFMSGYDPDYHYLYNALTFATGSNQIGHTDHPGTPLQLFGALVIKSVHFFRTDELVVDVLKNPEFYLKCIIYALLLLAGFCCWFLGYKVFKVSNNIQLALFLQATVFISTTAVISVSRLTTEAMFLSIVLIFIAYLFEYLHREQPPKKYAVLFGVLTGLILSIKISNVGIAIIPFILLPTFKEKIKYSLLSFLSFCLFISPIFTKFINHLNFLLGILTHSGKYGTGEEKIIDSSLFIENFNKVIQLNEVFTFALFISLFLLISKLLLKELSLKDKWHKALLALFLFFIFQILLVSKHFGYNYMLIADLFVPMMLFIVYKVFTQKSTFKLPVFLRKFGASLTILGLLLLFLTKYEFFPNFRHYYIDSQKAINKIIAKEPHPIVIYDNHFNERFGSPIKQMALFSGLAFSGDKRFEYAQKLNELYPGWYIKNGDAPLRSWEGEVFEMDFFAKNKRFYVYINEKEEQKAAGLIKQFVPDFYRDSVEISLKYAMVDKTDDRLYLVTNNKKLSYQFNETKYVNDLEQIQNNMFVSPNGFNLKKAEFASKEKAHSGINSIVLDPDKMAYGLDVKIPVKPNDFVLVKVWCAANNNKNAIVLSAENFYSAGANKERTEGDWELLKYQTSIPPDFRSDSLTIYLWNFGNSPVYFDDLEVKVLSPK